MYNMLNKKTTLILNTNWKSKIKTKRERRRRKIRKKMRQLN